jgi:hypothetical protein
MIQVGESKVHPVDFGALKKGDVLTRKQIEEITGMRLADSEKNYNFAKLNLKQRIEKERPDLYPRGEGHDIVIMTDAAAEAYNRSRTAQDVDSLVRNSARRTRIDRSGFSPEAKRGSESRDRSYQGIALMAQSALKKAEREALLFEAPPKQIKD